MRQHDDQSAVVRVYNSLWNSMLLGAVCLIFAAGGVFLILHEDGNTLVKIIGGWLNVLFFGVGGLAYLAVVLYMRICHMPVIVIYADKLEYGIPLRRKRYTVCFKDVDRFRMVKVASSEMMAIDYKKTVVQDKFDAQETSRLKECLMSFNREQTGAIEAIPTENLSMKGKEICDILNDRVKRYAGEAGNKNPIR